MRSRPVALAALVLLLCAPTALAETFTDPTGDASHPSTDIVDISAAVLSDRILLNVTMAGAVDATGVYTHCDIKINPGAADEEHYGVALLFGVFGGNRYVDGKPQRAAMNDSSYAGSTIRFVEDRNETVTKSGLSLDCRTERQSVADIAAKSFPDEEAPDAEVPLDSEAPKASSTAPGSEQSLKTVAVGEGSTPAPGVLLGILALLVGTVRRKA